MPLIGLCVKLMGVISELSILEHMHKRKNGTLITSCQIPASVPTNDHAQSRFRKYMVNSEYANGRILLLVQRYIHGL